MDCGQKTTCNSRDASDVLAISHSPITGLMISTRSSPQPHITQIAVCVKDCPQQTTIRVRSSLLLKCPQSYVPVSSLVRLYAIQHVLYCPTIIFCLIIVDLFVRSTSRSPDGRVDVCARDRSRLNLFPIMGTRNVLTDPFIRLSPTPCFDNFKIPSLP